MAEGDEKKKDESGGEPGESEKERRDRELIELLNELRVILPGVQVLFAFLLTVPFSNGYSKITDLQKDVYFVAFICATVATLCLIAPSTFHRIQFRHGDKEEIIRTSNHLVIEGTAFLAASMSAAVFVITDVLFGVPSAAGIAIAAAVAFAWLWYAVPVYRRIRERRSSGSDS